MRDVDLGTSASRTELAPASILVVSADPVRRDHFCCEVLRAGYTVSATADDVAALQRLRRQFFDLVLLDDVMPRGTVQRIVAALGKMPDGINPPAILAVGRACEKETLVNVSAHGDVVPVNYVEIGALLPEVDGKLALRFACPEFRSYPGDRKRPVPKPARPTQLSSGSRGHAEYESVLVEALEVIEVGFVLWDADDRLLVCNAGYRRLFGRDGEHVVPGARFEDLMRLQLESGRLRVAPNGQLDWLDQRIRRHHSPNGPIEEEFSDGEWIRVSESRTCAGYTVGVYSEISQVKRREIALKTFAESNRRLAAAVDAAGSAILITDPARSGNPTVFANPAFASMTGWPVEEALGRDRSFLNGPKTDLDEVARFERDMQEGRSTSAVLRLKVRNGRSFWADVSASPIRNSDGKVVNWVIVQTDVTTRERLTQRDRPVRKPEQRNRLAPQSAPEADDFAASLQGNQ